MPDLNVTLTNLQNILRKTLTGDARRMARRMLKEQASNVADQVAIVRSSIYDLQAIEEQFAAVSSLRIS